MDGKLKKAAQIKAKRQGISLSDLFKSAASSFLSGTFNVELVSYGTYTPNAKTARELRQSRKEIEAGIGLSPVFTDMKKMDAYLRNLK